MGTSTSTAQLLGKMDKFVGIAPKSNRAATLQAADLVKNTVVARMRMASGGDLRLSGVGKKGAKIGVRYNINGTISANALVRATGPVQFVENRVKPHLIGPKGVKGGTRQKRGTVNRTGLSKRLRAVDEGTAIYGKRDVIGFGNGEFARYAAHPGVPVGKKPWAKGVAEAAPKTPQVFAEAYHRALVEAFR